MGERVHYSTAAELLREDTFEAERLMELHTFHDYKERQLARLKQEEKELIQIINDKKEIIASFGSSVGVSAEASGEVSKIIEQLAIDNNNIAPSLSARGTHDYAQMLQPIYTSGSANDLFHDIDKQLDALPTNESSSITFNQHHSHTFSQSRQNFYAKPSPETILLELQETNDFSQTFEKYPLPLLFFFSFFDHQAFPVNQLNTTIESFPTARRQKFINALFADLRRSSKIISLLIKLFNVDSHYNMTSLCEGELSSLFGINRSCFLSYDQENEGLIFLKEKIKICFPVKSGIFQRALSTQSPIEARITDPEVTVADKKIIQESKSVYIMPVLSIRSQFQVDGLLLLFDKPGITKSDVLALSIFARCIATMIPSIDRTIIAKNRVSSFEKAVKNYVALCTSSELGTIVSHISLSFSLLFNCESVKLFKVSNRYRTFRELTKFETLEDPISTSTGIVGHSIQIRKSLNTTKPQFHEHYSPEVDCYNENSFSSSLLICPIINKKGLVKWAIACYNKKDVPSFTQLDQETLETMCSHVLPVLSSAWVNRKLKKTITRSKKQVDQAEALTDVIASLKSPSDITSMIQRMTKFFRENTDFSYLTLLRIDRFRKELINTEGDVKEIIPLNADNPAALCARTGKMIDGTNPLDGSRQLFFPVRNSKSTVLGVFRMSGGEEIGPQYSENSMGLHQPIMQKSSLSLLNTFRSSMSSTHILTFSGTETGRDIEDEDMDKIQLRRMITMWQRIAGSVLEGADKDDFYTRMKRLIDSMSVALYDNLFECSFKVWQEVQYLVDDYRDIQSDLVEIHGPQIDDIVFANTTELSVKTVGLIKILGQINVIDESGFEKKQPSRDISQSTVYEEGEEGTQSTFIVSSAIDINSMDEGAILQNILAALRELGCLQFLGINESAAMEFLLEIRSIHPPNKFLGWKLAVDHFQYAAFLLMSTSFVKELSEVEMVSILIYLLSLYSDPCKMVVDGTPEKRAKFTLETSGLFSTVSSFFTANAWSENVLLEHLPQEEAMNLWNIIDGLDISSQQGAYIGASPCVLLCMLARCSYLMRETNVSQKWVEMRMAEENPDLDFETLCEIQIEEMSYEKDINVMPLLEEASNYDSALVALMERATINFEQILKC